MARKDYTAGVDIGGTKIAVGVFDPSGELVTKKRKKTPVHDSDAVLQVIAELVDQLSQDYKIKAIGIGVAGLVDPTCSRVLFAPNLGWVDEPLRVQVERMTGIPTVIENDGNAATWGEFVAGAGTKMGKDLVMLTIGTGIGAGVIVDGKLQRGAHGIAAEVGHMRLVPDGRLCGCGRHGCWEQYASGNALVRLTRSLASDRRGDADVLLSYGDGTPEGVQGPHITAAARRGDAVALEAFEILGSWLARGMVELATLLDPAGFVIGGGVIDAGDLLLAPTKREFANNVVSRSQQADIEILPAELGNLAGMYGSAALARDHLKSQPTAAGAVTTQRKSADSLSKSKD